MSYVSGFLLAVPEENRERYRAHAEAAWPIFQDLGCLALRECWGADGPEGKVTSFPMAVKKAEGEAVVFSWMEWPDKATADRAFAAMMNDPRMAALGEMPFDGMRMMWGGFETLVDQRA